MQREDLEKEIEKLNEPDYDFASELKPDKNHLVYLFHLSPEVLRALDGTKQRIYDGADRPDLDEEKENE